LKKQFFLKDIAIFVAIFLYPIGILIPHWYEFGINIKGKYLYYEDFLSFFAFSYIILNLAVKYKLVLNRQILLVFTIVILGILTAFINGNSILYLLKDIRIPFYIIVTTIFFFMIHKYITLKEVLLSIKVYIIVSVLYFIMILYSYLFKTFLYLYRDEVLSLGLDRLSYGNEISIFILTTVVIIFKKEKLIKSYWLFPLILQNFIYIITSLRRAFIIFLFANFYLYVKNIILLNFSKGIRVLAISVVFIFVFIMAIIFLGKRISLEEGSLATRLFSYFYNIEMVITNHPILGYGLGSVMLVTKKNIGGFDLEKNFVDSSIITSIYKFGIIFGSAYLISIFIIFKRFVKCLKEKNIILSVLFAFSIFSSYLITAQREIIYILELLMFLSIKCKYEVVEIEKSNVYIWNKT